MEGDLGALTPADTKKENRGDEEKPETQIEAGDTETQDALVTNEDEVQHAEVGPSESDGTTSQNKRKEECGVQLNAGIKEKKDEGELEEGELPDSDNEDNPTDPTSNLQSAVNDKEFGGPADLKSSVDHQCQQSGYRRAEVTLKRLWSRSSDHSDDTPDVPLNKRRCLCSGKDDVDEAHGRIQNNLVQLSLEITAPVTALFAMWKQRKERNEAVLPDIESGKAFSQTGWWHSFIAGSRAEGLCLHDEWGQEPADQDTMDMHGGAWGVRVQETEEEEEEDDTGCLVMVKAGCPPAYSRVLVDGRTRQMAERMAKDTTLNDIRQVAGCFMKEEDGQKWLSSQIAIRVLSPSQPAYDDDTAAEGPAIPAGTVEYVPALIGSKPVSGIKAYLNRSRRTVWPRQETLERIGKLPAILVPTGHKKSQDKDLEWRDSWSIHELILAQDMPRWVKQAFCGFKYTLKSHMALLRSQRPVSPGEGPVSPSEGRTQVGSYCMKTLLLWELEQPDVWRNERSSHLFSLLVARLEQYLQPVDSSGKCVIPHYFLPECNLLELVSHDELCLTRDCVRQIQQDPLTTIILMPKYPWHIYGGEVDDNPGINRIEALDAVAVQHGEELLDALLQLRDSHGTSEYGHCLEKLTALLTPLDRLRQEKYGLQCITDNDETWKMVERSSLCNLVTLARSLLQNG